MIQGAVENDSLTWFIEFGFSESELKDWHMDLDCPITRLDKVKFFSIRGMPAKMCFYFGFLRSYLLLAAVCFANKQPCLSGLP